MASDRQRKGGKKYKEAERETERSKELKEKQKEARS
jgi:hypothetical protein